MSNNFCHLRKRSSQQRASQRAASRAAAPVADGGCGAHAGGVVHVGLQRPVAHTRLLHPLDQPVVLPAPSRKSARAAARTAGLEGSCEGRTSSGDHFGAASSSLGEGSPPAPAFCRGVSAAPDARFLRGGASGAGSCLRLVAAAAARCWEGGGGMDGTTGAGGIEDGVNGGESGWRLNLQRHTRTRSHQCRP